MFDILAKYNGSLFTDANEAFCKDEDFIKLLNDKGLPSIEYYKGYGLKLNQSLCEVLEYDGVIQPIDSPILDSPNGTKILLFNLKYALLVKCTIIESEINSYFTNTYIDFNCYNSVDVIIADEHGNEIWGDL